MLEDKKYQRWYDEDSIVSRCVQTLEKVGDNLKRQTATFLMEEIIIKPPYSDMVPNDAFNMIIEESRKRRWYDFDEVVKIFMELLRHSPEDLQRKIALLAITFIEDLSLDKNRSVELKPEEHEF